MKIVVFAFLLFNPLVKIERIVIQPKTQQQKTFESLTVVSLIPQECKSQKVLTDWHELYQQHLQEHRDNRNRWNDQSILLLSSLSTCLSNRKKIQQNLTVWRKYSTSINVSGIFNNFLTVHNVANCISI